MTADLWTGAPFPPRRWQAEALPVCIDAMKRLVASWSST